jgi:predicted Fe-S protein YdhL (DUF1289 family)
VSAPATDRDAPGPASPCIGVCRLDPAERFCLGCGRTIEEIARWPTASAEERRAILARLAGRRRPGPAAGEDRAAPQFSTRRGRARAWATQSATSSGVGERRA